MIAVLVSPHGHFCIVDLNYLNLGRNHNDSNCFECLRTGEHFILSHETVWDANVYSV